MRTTQHADKTGIGERAASGAKRAGRHTRSVYKKGAREARRRPGLTAIGVTSAALVGAGLLWRSRRKAQRTKTREALTDYENTTFGYRGKYPDGLTPRTRSESDAGITLGNDHMTLKFFGTEAQADETLEDVAARHFERVNEADISVDDAGELILIAGDDHEHMVCKIIELDADTVAGLVLAYDAESLSDDMRDEILDSLMPLEGWSGEEGEEA